MKKLTGTIISAKMQNVATVSVERYYKHPKYKKILKRNIKIHAVNKLGAKTGDTVILEEGRKTAKTVSFVIKEILNKNSNTVEKSVKQAEKPKIIKKKKKQLKSNL